MGTGQGQGLVPGWRTRYPSVQSVAGQPGVLAAPSPPCFCSHRGAASCAEAWRWQGPGGQLSLWAGKACPSPGRDAPHPFLVARHRRAQGQPQKGSGQGPGPAVRRSQSSAWLSRWDAGEHHPDSRTATETHVKLHRSPVTPWWRQGVPQHQQKSTGSATAPCQFLLFCPGEGAQPPAYLVVGVGIEQSLLVAQLGWGGQQDMLQVPLHQWGKQQWWGLLQVLSCWQAGVWGQWDSPGLTAERQEPRRQTVLG